MVVVAVIGAQWGDEGKGKTIDELSQRADFVVRYQGGSNAGHRVVHEKEEFKFRLVLLAFSTPIPHVLSATVSSLTQRAHSRDEELEQRASICHTCISVTGNMSLCHITSC